MADIFTEETDIWPYRAFHQENNGDQNQPNWIGAYNIDVECTANRDAVNHQPRQFHPILADHYVRIPSMLLHFATPVPNLTEQQKIIQSWRNRPMRADPKTHVFINSNMRTLNFIDVYWDYDNNNNPPTYVLAFSNAVSLSAVYPCFRPVLNGVPRMLFGVCFCRRTGAQYTRSYFRYDFEDTHSTGAFDITQDFFSEPNPAQPMAMHYTNGTLFQRDNDWNSLRNSIAFYVCRGARLMVGDNRNVTANLPGHTRSLYQAGSLVVCTGTRGIAFSVTEQNGPNNVNYGWGQLNAPQNLIVNPVNRTRRQLDNWEQHMDQCDRLLDFRDHVFFLGAIESEFNSACWKLHVNNHGNNDYCQIRLFLPNQGVIEDIAPWRTGFELVRARQRYEQPWRAVIGCPVNAQVPAFQAPGDPYVFRRILGLHDGVDQHWGPLTIDFPYHTLQISYLQIPPLLPQDHIQRYMINNLQLAHFERLTEWHQSAWKDVMPPPGPPLLPPIKTGPQTYKNLNQYVRFSGFVNNQATFVTDAVPGQQFQLKSIKDAPGYKWLTWTEDRHDDVIKYNQAKGNPNVDWSEWSKWCEDHMMYLKMSDETNYKTHMWYLQQI